LVLRGVLMVVNHRRVLLRLHSLVVGVLWCVGTFLAIDQSLKEVLHLHRWTALKVRRVGSQGFVDVA
jgi:hypothetical protein